MKSLRNAVFATLLLLAGAVAACSDEGGAINVGEIDMGVSAADLGDAAFGACDDFGNCDGDLGNEEIRGGDGDAFAFFALLWWEIYFNYSDEGLTGTEAYDTVIDAIPDEVEQIIAFAANDSVDCDEGSIELATVFRGNFANTGYVGGSDEFAGLVIRFLNCVIQGDLLADDGDPAVTLNGTIVYTEEDPEEATETTPFRARITGVVTLDTEYDDGAPAAARGGISNGDPFWNDVVTFNATYTYDGSDSAENGGACAGEAISFGADNTTDTDDECAADTDGVNDAFIDAGALLD